MTSCTTSSTRGRLLARTAAGSGALLVLSAGALALAAPASAHMTVHPTSAPSGSYQKLSVRVPNESTTAGTVAVAISLPTDTPLASVRVKPHAGWDAELTRTALPEPVTSGDLEITEAVTRITWTAEPGVQIGPGQFEEFDISVGPLPDGVDSLSLPATQTHDDGEVVAWDQPVVDGAAEPEHPSPVLAIGPAEADASSAAGTATVAAGTRTSAAGGSADPTDTTARVLGAGGLALGAAGIGAAAATTLAHRRRRQA